MGTTVPLKMDSKNWREVKLRRKKWKEERTLKKLKKMEESKNAKSQPSAVKDTTKQDLRTYSLAVPGSILQNAQSGELRAYLAGQIARAACIYKINEVIVFNDEGDLGTAPVPTSSKSSKCCIQFGRLLQYLECPQYLRKHFFPLHNNLQYAGVMNPLDAPHHLRLDDDFPYREGITTDKPVKNGKGTYVDVGLLRQVFIEKNLKPGLRVTVKMDLPKLPVTKKLRGTVVPPDTPLKDLNAYWGYNVRIANSLSEVFLKSPYAGGYDLTIGTSDKGQNIDEVKRRDVKNFKHCLIVFGGVHGLECALENDNNITELDVSLLFDYYLNTCPGQGSRTIRTEEAVLITLAELRKKIYHRNAKTFFE